MAMASRQTRRQFLAKASGAGAGAAVTLALRGYAMAGLRSSAQAGEADAELILFNGSVATMDTRGGPPRASALAVREGRFVAVGNDADVLRLKGPGTRSI